MSRTFQFAEAGRSSTSAPLGGGLISRRRQRLQIGLGFIWLIDAALQYQPYMFTRQFVVQTLQPTAVGVPWILHRPMIWADHFMVHDIAVWNALYASFQLAIAIGLFWRPTVRLALAASMVWAVAVWWFAEGFGGIFSGGASPVMGGPGAVILYGLIAVLLWPARSTDDGISVAAGSCLGRSTPKVLWALLWGSFAYYLLLPANRGAQGLHGIVVGMASGEPGWIRSMDSGLAAVLAHHGTEFSVGLALVCVAIAIGVFAAPLTRLVLGGAVVVAVVAWLFEDFGGVFTAQGTDVNSGPLLVLLACAYWPVGARVSVPALGPARARVPSVA